MHQLITDTKGRTNKTQSRRSRRLTMPASDSILRKDSRGCLNSPLRHACSHVIVIFIIDRTLKHFQRGTLVQAEDNIDSIAMPGRRWGRPACLAASRCMGVAPPLAVQRVTPLLLLCEPPFWRWPLRFQPVPVAACLLLSPLPTGVT